MNTYIPRIRKYKEIKPATMQKPITTKMGFGGSIRLELEHPNGEKQWVTDWIHNGVTYTGLRMLSDDLDRFNCCQIGSNNEPFDIGQTSIYDWVAGTSQRSITQSGSMTISTPRYAYRTYRYEFPPGIISSIKEIVIGKEEVYGDIFSRTVLSEPVNIEGHHKLSVYYALRLYPGSEINNSMDTSYEYNFIDNGVTHTRLVSSVPQLTTTLIEEGGWMGGNAIDKCLLGKVYPGPVTGEDTHIQLFSGTYAYASSASQASFNYGIVGMVTTCSWLKGVGTQNISSIRVRMGSNPYIGQDEQIYFRPCFPANFTFSEPIEKKAWHELVFQYQTTWQDVNLT